MITNKEIAAVNLSPTKKDFYQIWNELLDTAGKISNRWDPTSTNEADPGIVLLKVLAALGDKLNYNVDKNILEAFMPSATQEESMRRLCDMLGYAMRYYISATTLVNISYNGKPTELSGEGITIGAFTNLKNNEDDINYFTLEPITLTDLKTSGTVPVMEGELCECESDDDNIISVALLDDNYRYYLPEDKIAENGIFIQNYSDGFLSELWDRVDNLNTQPLNKKIFKFGYSSSKQMPYVQFPEDINDIIEDGLYIRYTRTHGINGNISAGILSAMEKPSDWPEETSTNPEKYTISNYNITNISAATNGANPETIDQAYNSYKRTIGTFDTLVTCRDYMNKIYQMITSDTDATPLVSNVIVSDIRDDINKAVTLCTFSEYGMCYQNISRVAKVKDANQKEKLVNAINSFDLILYPFKAYFNLGKKDDYVNSFKYTASNNYAIKANLEDSKTIAHNIIDPDSTDIACIKNYVKLNAKIVTVRKVNSIEEKLILANVYKALYNEFNMRMLEFGEPIPTEVMLNCIKEADNRIKDVYWSADPELYTAFCTVGGGEYLGDNTQYDSIYNKLAINNVLAGRVSLFEYNDDFAYSYNINTTETYPKANDSRIISKLTSSFELPISGGSIEPEYTLQQNELIQFRAPNFRTGRTYSAYVLFYFDNGISGRGHDKELICAAGSTYKLKNTDELYIKYTTTTTNPDGSTTSDTKCEYYDASSGLIIKPNFDLKNRDGSTNAHGTSFGPFGPNKKYIEKMFSLGATDAIEVVEEDKVELNKKYTYLYWHRNDEAQSITKDGNILFNFDEDDDHSYTLKDGEYVCYTDINKTDLVVYTSGTRVSINENSTIKLSKSVSDLEISAEEILTNGIAASIPWKQYNFTLEDYLTLTSYQYITLGEGDTLKDIITDKKVEKLTNTWIPITDAEYQYSTAPTSQKLPYIDVDTDSKWEAHTILAINMGPDVDQVLHWHDAIKIYYTDKDNPGTDAGYDTINGGDYAPVILNSNYICNTTTGSVDTLGTEIVGTEIEYTITDFKLRKKDTDDKAIADSEVNNYGKNLTKIALEQGEEKKLNIRGVSKENFGLVMIYNTAPSDTDPEANNYIILDTDNATKYDYTMSIYNLTSTDGWWDKYHTGGGSIAERYYLKPGVNMIMFTKDCSITLVGNSESASHALIFDMLHIVKGINSKLDYKSSDTTDGGLSDALKQIAEVDTNNEFYYSAELETASLIDLNANDANAKLSTPTTWYDYNNINNKFVISELDANYLAKGITLALSSKL